MRLFPVLFALLLLAPLAFGEDPAPPKEKPEPSCELTLQEFMKSKIEATVKQKDMKKEERDRRLALYVGALAELAPKASWNEGPRGWRKMAEEAVAKKDWGRSCKNCHMAFEKKYQKSYKERKICLDPSVLE